MHLIVPQKYWKTAAVIIIAMVVLVFAGRYILKMGHEISIEVLKNVIHVETQGNYAIDFEEVSLSLRKKKLAISGLTLQPIVPEQDFDKTIYQVDIDSVVVHLESLSSIYLDRELAIDSVRIIDPTLRLVNPEQASESSSFSLQTGNLYQLITDQLAVLKIDKFHLENGELSHSPSNFKLDGFDFQLGGLLMDSLVQSDRVFFSTAITLEINDQLLLLPDSIHEVGFEQFLLSTTDSVLRFRNVFMRPSASSGYQFQARNDVNVYDIKVPELMLQGIDYYRAYKDNVLSIDKVAIERSQIKIDNEEAIEGDTISNNLLELLTDVFDTLAIDELSLGDASIDLKLNSGGSDQRLLSNRTDVALYGLILDSANAVLDERNRYFDSASFILRDYTYNLPDSIHRLYVRALTLSSTDSSIVVEDLRLAPDRNPNSSRTLAYLDVPYSSMTGVHFKEALLGDRLRLDDYFVAEPSLRILPDLKNRSKNKQAKFTPQDLFDILSIRYNDFKSASFEVYDAQIQVENLGIIRDVNFSFSNIGLNQRTALWTDMIDQMDVQTNKVQWRLDTMKLAASGIAVSKKGREVLISNVSVKDPQEQEVFSSQSLRLSGHKPNRLVAGQFYTDTLTLTAPQLSWELPRKKDITSDSISDDPMIIQLPKQIGYLKVIDGSFDLYKDSVRLATTSELQLHMSADENQPLDLLQTGALEITMEAGPVTQVSTAGVSYSRSFRDLVIDGLQVTGGQHLNLASQQVTLAGLYQKALFRDQHVLASMCKIGDLEVALDIEGLPKATSSSSSKVKVSFGTVVLDNLRTAVRWGDERSLDWSGGQVKILEFSSLSDELLTDDGYLRGRSGTFSGAVMLTDKEQEVTVSGINLDHTLKTVTTDSISWKRGDQLQADLYQLAVEGYSPDRWWDHREVQLGEVTLGGSNISLRREEQELSRQVIKLPFSQLAIDAVLLEDNYWSLTDQFNGTITSLNELDITSSQFRLDSLSDMNRWFDFMQELTVSGADFKQPLPDEYQLQVGAYAFDLSANQIQFSDIALTPAEDRYTYSKRQQVQKSWYDLTVDQVTVSTIDWESLAKRRYIIDRVDVENVEASVYRDKNNPFPEGQYRAMPQKALQMLDFPLWVDTLGISATIEYRERPIDNDQEGVMTFNEVEGWMYDVRTEDTLANQPMMFLASGKLFDSAPFNVKVNFDMNGPDYPFRMQGSVTDFDLVTLNQMLGPVAGVNIRSGYGEKIEFNFLADDKVALGDMRFRYNDLKIDILNKKTHEAHGLGSGIKTFFANTFVVKKKNSGLSYLVKKGQVFYERDTSRAVFNYWGKALISGAVSNIGINKSDKAAKKYRKSLAKARKDD